MNGGGRGCHGMCSNSNTGFQYGGDPIVKAVGEREPKFVLT
jgi:hypothetical protein